MSEWSPHVCRMSYGKNLLFNSQKLILIDCVFQHILADARLKDETATCPNCRVVISKDICQRNLAVEKAVCELPCKCKFCGDEYPRATLDKHQYSECEERATTCLYSVIGCPWRGPHHEASESSSRDTFWAFWSILIIDCFSSVSWGDLYSPEQEGSRTVGRHQVNREPRCRWAKAVFQHFWSALPGKDHLQWSPNETLPHGWIHPQALLWDVPLFGLWLPMGGEDSRQWRPAWPVPVGGSPPVVPVGVQEQNHQPHADAVYLTQGNLLIDRIDHSIHDLLCRVRLAMQKSSPASIATSLARQATSRLTLTFRSSIRMNATNCSRQRQSMCDSLCFKSWNKTFLVAVVSGPQDSGSRWRSIKHVVNLLLRFCSTSPASLFLRRQAQWCWRKACA